MNTENICMKLANLFVDSEGFNTYFVNLHLLGLLKKEVIISERKYYCYTDAGTTLTNFMKKHDGFMSNQTDEENRRMMKLGKLLVSSSWDCCRCPMMIQNSIAEENAIHSAAVAILFGAPDEYIEKILENGKHSVFYLICFLSNLSLDSVCCLSCIKREVPVKIHENLFGDAVMEGKAEVTLTIDGEYTWEFTEKDLKPVEHPVLKLLKGETAESLSRKLNLKTIPVNIEKAARDLHIRLVPIKDTNTIKDAMISTLFIDKEVLYHLSLEEDHIMVYYASVDSKEIRFIVAHAIAYCCVYTNELICSKKHSELYKTCRSGDVFDFAVRLLAPLDIVSEFHKTFPNMTIKQIAETFKTPYI